MQQIAMVLGCLCLAACGDPEQEFRVKVVNEDGRPMAGVDCQAGFYRASESGTGPRSYPVKGRTDASGQVELRGETCFFNSAVRTRAEGHYDCLVDKLWITGRSGDRWEPWPVEVELVMREIRKPHPMRAVKCGAGFMFRFPGNKMGPFGFDLLARDWVAPHGAGKVADFVMEGIHRDPGDQSVDPKGWIRITFSNEGDGILPDAKSLKSGGSLMIGRYEAPEDGYLGEWKFANFVPERPSDEVNPIPGAPLFLFRIRSTVVDGKVEQGLYGKIHAGLFPVLSPNIVAFRATYYLNAEPNERNLEWDMKTNLFADLPRERWPRQP